MISLFTVQKLLQGLYRPGLDCDGQSRVFHYFLSELGIPHQLYVGEIEEKGSNRGFDPHFWIRLSVKEGPAAIIDYKARKWLGNDQAIPFGVFLIKDYPHMSYRGRAFNEPSLSPSLIEFLLSDHFTGETIQTERS